MDFQTCLGQYPPMSDFDYHGSLILRRLAEGMTMKETAMVVGMTRQGIYWRCAVSPDFALAVTAARETGKDERTFRLWLRHPFRGMI